MQLNENDPIIMKSIPLNECWSPSTVGSDDDFIVIDSAVIFYASRSPTYDSYLQPQVIALQYLFESSC